MNCLNVDKQLAVIAALIEGNSIRSISRMTGVHKTTIQSLLYRVGDNCERLMQKYMRNLSIRTIQADEIWCFVGKKQGRLTEEERGNGSTFGDQYVYVAMDPDTKLVPVYDIGRRDRLTTIKFIKRLEARLNNRIQLFTDAYVSYREAVYRAFGTDIDFAQIRKYFGKDHKEEHRYSPPTIISLRQRVICGNPDAKDISTSLVERQNLTMRMQMRRFTRLTNGFSKSLKGLRAAVALHFAHYNFCRIHSTIKCTPAMEAGITNNIWKIDALLVY